MSAIHAQVRAMIAQVAAIKEQATAIGMQAETAERTMQALLASLPAEAPEPTPVTPPRPKYFNQPAASSESS